MRVFLIGFMGSGKTHRGKQLSEQLNIPFLDLDEEITSQEKKSVSQIFVEYGEEFFRQQEKSMLESLIAKYPSMVLSCGGGTPCFFNNIDTMKKYGTVVWLNTPVDVLIQRLVQEKEKRPLIRDISDADLRLYIVRKLNERRMYYERADVILNKEDTCTVEEIVQTILHA